MTDAKKLLELKEFVAGLDSVLIAFSGGLDSSFLAKVAVDVLKEKTLAVTAVSATYQSSEIEEAKLIAREIGIKHILVDTEELSEPEFIKNPLNRCYWCKKELFTKLRSIAAKEGFKNLVDGTTYDDRYDVRPGFLANDELSVVSPLYECKVEKPQIRLWSQELGLSFSGKPSGTCLSSRIPFGKAITLAKLKKIEAAEEILKFYFGRQTLLRARDHDEILRIELECNSWTKLDLSGITDIIIKLKNIGYKYITFDLEGYLPAGKR